MDTVLFNVLPAKVVTVKNAPRFMARLITDDAGTMATGEVRRTAMLNAVGGMIATLLVARTSQQTYELVLQGDNTDACEAWIRQLAQALDAEIDMQSVAGFFFVGSLPIAGVELRHGAFVQASGLTFADLGWIKFVCGPQVNIDALHDNLLAAGAKKGEQTGFDALRILAREPASGLEYDESTSPLECGLTGTLDFSDDARIFIGRALTEARAKAGCFDKLQLIAFAVPFDPSLLVDVPQVAVDDQNCQLTSIARIPEIPLTVGLVRLPSSVDLGDKVKTVVHTDPRTFCESAVVIDAQF